MRNICLECTVRLIQCFSHSFLACTIFPSANIISNRLLPSLSFASLLCIMYIMKLILFHFLHHVGIFTYAYLVFLSFWLLLFCFYATVVLSGAWGVLNKCRSRFWEGAGGSSVLLWCNFGLKISLYEVL